MNTTVKQEANVQLNLTWDEYTRVMHAFKTFTNILEERTGVNEKELWDIYNKMYMNRRVKDTWYNTWCDNME